MSSNAYRYVMVKFAFTFRLNIDNKNEHMKLIASHFDRLYVTIQNVHDPDIAVKFTVVNEIILRV